MITIFTPTYNREKYLTRVYESLLSQADDDFEWVIVDDGSEDESSKLIEKFITENKIAIKYAYTTNGGKHRAINIGAKLAEGEWFLFLDSDDWLNDDAVFQIKSQIKLLKDRQSDERFYAVIGLCETADNQLVGSVFYGESLEVDYFDSVFKYGIIGDKAWVVRTDLLKNYPFPEYEGEKFLTEAIWFVQMARLGYACRFFNKKIKKIEYLSDGLSSRYYQLLAENWQGALRYYNDFFVYMAENNYSIWGFFNGFLMIARMASKNREEILDGLHPKILSLYSNEINQLLQKI